MLTVPGGHMSKQFDKLISSLPVITDGAWGTQLQALGLAAGECPDEWNLTHPDRVRSVAARYVGAGSRVILTNTFGGNRISLGGHGLAGKVEAINRAGVVISRDAAGARALVFASIGPTGKMLMSGDVSETDMAEAYGEQARVLAAAGADALVIETMSDLEEASIAVRAATATGLPVVASMVFDSGKGRDRTMMGSTPEQVADALSEAGADVIGANCGLGMEGYIPIGKRLRAASKKPVWIKPNAGLPELSNGVITYKTTPEEFARQAIALRDAGVAFIGGCCGTSPLFIAALTAALKH
jgi:5-methyltetrahydrofolate--homocysteine methyltransferase